MSAFRFIETTLYWYRTKNGAERAQLMCPVCGKYTETRVNHETVMKSFPLICRKCHSLTLIDYSKGVQKVRK